jgi:hypothetical protein
MGGAVFRQVLELDEAAARPARPELRRPDLEIEIGLAAGLDDLAPAGADLVALSGVNAMVGGVVEHLLDRDDSQRRACPRRRQRRAW